MSKVAKAFGADRVLHDVSFTLCRGEVRCLAGENGSGKSTLIKILSGVLNRDAGHIRLFGEAIGDGEAQHAIDLGLCVIYQDLALFPNLTVLENIAFLRTIRHDARLARWRDWRALALATFRRMGVRIDPDAPVELLSVAEKQLVAIARALAMDARVIVMDEPTTALTRSDVDRLFALVRALRDDGVSFLFVSHKVEEIFEICDTVTVLRDGKVAAEGGIAAFDRRRFALAMTGREILDERLAPPLPAEPPVFLSVRRLGRRGAFHDVSFDIRQGEIVSVVGLRGSGQRELALALFGLLPADTGEIRIGGQPVRIASVGDALAQGIALVPEDRLSEGLFMDLPIRDNIAVSSLARYQRPFGRLDLRALRQAAAAIASSLRIKTRDIADPVNVLSGGNQQRVMLARWIERSPKLMILNGPTVGVDIASKRDIHDLLVSLSRAGMAMLVVADDLAEVIAVSHRVLVMAGGTLTGAHQAAQVDEHGLAAEITAGMAS